MQFVIRILLALCIVITVGCYIAHSWYTGTTRTHIVDTGWCAFVACWFLYWATDD